MQAVEPAPGLVHSLADVIGGEFPLLLKLVHIVDVQSVPLGEWHRSRVEPGVHNLGDAAHLAVAAIGGAFQQDIVYVGTVQVQCVQLLPVAWRGVVLEILNASDAQRFGTFLALPDGDGRSPIPFPGDGPVHVVAQPLAEPALFDVVGIPVDGAVA